MKITEPGLYDDIDEITYHSDPYSPSLSSTMAKLILKSPAHLRYYLDEGQDHKPAFDFGSAVHSMGLGKGWPVTVLDFPDWRSKEARLQREAANISGSIPLLRKDFDQVEAVVSAIREHPIAGPLFAGNGRAEVSAFAEHESGVKLRGRFDWITESGVLVDLKTAQDADPSSFGRTAAGLSYEVQAAHYMLAYWLATGYPARGFIHVLVEKEPPYLVSVVQLDDEALQAGHEQLEVAIARYMHCLATDTWPGYPATIHSASLPVWKLHQIQDMTQRDDPDD